MKHKKHYGASRPVIRAENLGETYMATTEVLLPLMGEGVNEATVSSWLVQVGGKVSKDSPLLEVSTDKVDTEIPAPADGFLLKTLVHDGDTVEVNQVLAVIADSMDESAENASSGSSAPKAAKQESAPAATQKPAAAPVSKQSHDVKSSPLVRKIAAEQLDTRFRKF